MKFISVKGNPYIRKGPSGQVYLFYARVEQPTEVTNPSDIEWALGLSKDTEMYLQCLREYDKVVAQVKKETTKENIFSVVQRSVPASPESSPMSPELEVEEKLETEVEDEDNLSDEDSPTEDANDGVWFEELNPDHLGLSVHKLMVVISDFFHSNLLETREDRIKYIRLVLEGDTRVTLEREVEELFDTKE